MQSPYASSFLSDDGTFMSPGSDGATPLPGASVQTASTPSPQDSLPVQATQPLVSAAVELVNTDANPPPPPVVIVPPKDNTKLYLGIAAAVLIGWYLLKKKR